MNWLSKEQINAAAKESDQAALEMSIEHWQQIYDATDEEWGDGWGEDEVRVGQLHCALCRRYLGSTCYKCPLRENDANGWSRGNCVPQWMATAREANEGWLNRKPTALVMLNLLKDIHKKLYKNCENCEFFGESKGGTTHTCKSKTNRKDYVYSDSGYTCQTYKLKKGTEMTKQELYKAMQALWVEEGNVKVGDTMKVLRAPKENELGFCGSNGKMDENYKEAAVGYEYKVKYINPNGIVLERKNSFPFFCLEKIKSVEKPEVIELRFVDGQGRDITDGMSETSKRAYLEKQLKG